MYEYVDMYIGTYNCMVCNYLLESEQPSGSFIPTNKRYCM